MGKGGALQKRLTKQTLMAMQLGRCVHCLCIIDVDITNQPLPANAATFEHLLPKSEHPETRGKKRGGNPKGRSMLRCRLSCSQCNTERGNINLKMFWQSPELQIRLTKNTNELTPDERVWLELVRNDTMRLFEMLTEAAKTYTGTWGEGNNPVGREAHNLVSMLPFWYPGNAGLTTWGVKQPGLITRFVGKIEDDSIEEE